MSTMKVINFQRSCTMEKGYDDRVVQFSRPSTLHYYKNGFGSNTNRMLKRIIRLVCSRICAIYDVCAIILFVGFHRAIFEGCVAALVLCFLTMVREATTVDKYDLAVVALILYSLIHNINKLWDKMPCWGMVSLDLVADLIAGSRVKRIRRGDCVLNEMDKPWLWLISKRYAYVNRVDNVHKRFGDAYKGNLKVLCASRRGMPRCLEIRAVIHNRQIRFLVDTGSHHNIISQSYVKLFGLVPVSAPAFRVHIASGKKMEINSLCEGVKWEMEGVKGIEFETNFYVLASENGLAVLGMDWLGTLGRTICDFAIPSMKFRKGGKMICFRGSTVEVYPARNWLLLTGIILVVIVVLIVLFKLIL